MTNHKKIFIFGIRFNFQIQYKNLVLGCTKGFHLFPNIAHLMWCRLSQKFSNQN